MSKWFNITIVVLVVLWLSLLSLSQLRLTYAMHKYNVIIMQHESDLARIKMLMRPPMIQAKPTPQVAPSAPPLARKPKACCRHIRVRFASYSAYGCAQVSQNSETERLKFLISGRKSAPPAILDCA